MNKVVDRPISDAPSTMPNHAPPRRWHAGGRVIMPLLTASCLPLAILMTMSCSSQSVKTDSQAIGQSESDAHTEIVPRSVVPELAASVPSFKICHDQTYALCAVSSCLVYNQVAYCKCDVEHGDSISLPFEFSGQNVCDVNAEGPANGYMVSTFSLPESVVKGGDMALYTCPGGAADGSYAQCDGGLCFTSTEASPSFPGFDEPLGQDQIICSCPITTANPDGPTFGYQIAGPFPCETSFFDNCKSSTTNKRTGTTIPVGAPTGIPRVLTRLLNDAPVPQLNVCTSPAGR
ncbi:MAG: hypothetical protein L0H63_06970 [Nitrococcus sp.]|nr:hypothetical protein [Nitrococcus sp.]